MKHEQGQFIRINEAGKLRAHVAGQFIEGKLNFRNSGEAYLGTVQIDAAGDIITPVGGNQNSYQLKEL